MIYQCKFTSGTFQTFRYEVGPITNYLSCRQIHSDKIVTQNEIRVSSTAIDADGIICYERKTPMLIRTADCLVVLIIGEKGNAFIHAGHRGLFLGILQNKVLATIKPKFAFIGPSISPPCYQVGSELADQFGSQFQCYFKFIGGKLTMDLVQIASFQLKATWGIDTLNSGVCTYTDTRFHSYRRNKTAKRNHHFFIPKG